MNNDIFVGTPLLIGSWKNFNIDSCNYEEFLRPPECQTFVWALKCSIEYNNQLVCLSLWCKEGLSGVYHCSKRGSVYTISQKASVTFESTKLSTPDSDKLIFRAHISRTRWKVEIGLDTHNSPRPRTTSCQNIPLFQCVRPRSSSFGKPLVKISSMLVPYLS